jgi:CRISPR-associated endonuclease/helicase Cas3
VNPLKGALALTPAKEIITDVQKLYRDLKRVDVLDARRPHGWTDDEIAELAVQEVEKTGSCLIIVNMKKSARSLFAAIQGKTTAECFHLSTSMCPVHRKKVLTIIRKRIKPENNLPTICVSTQLIEAGVDVDFGSVIRYNAGLDSIAQAAGRCNRNGIRNNGTVYIVNPAEEKIDYLKDIAIGKDKTEKVLSDFKDNPEQYKNDRIGPDLLAWYYRNYFFERKNDMEYPVSSHENGRDDTLLSLLSTNELAVQNFARTHGEYPPFDLRQSFMTAGKLFKSIDAPTQSVIVQYGEAGENLVSQLSAAFEVEKEYKLLHETQQYSVNLFPQEFEKLKDAGALFPVQESTEIYYLDRKYYSEQFGISMGAINKEGLLNV